MGKRLKRLIEEEERTVAKLDELQTHLKEIRIARKQEEDMEIVRSIRTMKLGARELFDLLSGIQSGSISIEMLPAPEKKEEEQEEEVSLESEAGEEEKIVKGADHALEREEDLYEEEN